MSNFAFLKAEWPNLHAEATKAEANVLADPRSACFYSRRTLELLVAWLFQADRSLKLPYKSDLSAFLFEPSFKALVGPMLHAKMEIIRKRGNDAVHSQREVRERDAQAVVSELFHVAYWLARTYARTAAGRPGGSLRFEAILLPVPAAQAALQTQAQLRQLEDELAQRDEALAKAQQRNAALDEERARLRAEVEAAKAANKAIPDSHDYNEAQTRDLFIDQLLHEAGWTLDSVQDREFEVSGMPNQQGVGFVDYVLWGDDGKPLALVEAKRTSRDAQEGQQQAKLYADCLEQRYGQRPLIYYSNGYEHWLWDDAMYPPRLVQGFHKKDELALLVQRRSSRKPLGEATIDPAIVERHYQQRAIRRIGETFEHDRQRKALVVMATGAGKTRTVIALTDLLMRCNWAKRILFLADRVALVNQAAGAFKKFLPDVAPVNLVTEKNTEGRVYVSTYPTMMGLINEKQEGPKRFGIGHFDLIVIDEAHRSVYQKYRAIFSYFDALLVGLTATPKDEIDRNTYSLFNLESGVPTDAYTLDDAIAERYLVKPRGVSVPLKFQRGGIRYDDLSEDEKDQWDELDWGDEEEPPEEVNAEAVNRWLFNEDTVDKMLQVLMERGHKVAGGDRLGKTIIFAKNNDHADFIARRFDANYPDKAGAFARTITYKLEYAQTLIDDFSIKDKAPHIAISVDMLDTGIDVPEVVNLVFFKLVRSKAKFWQMVGRGTRLCKNLYGPGPEPENDKQDFYIFDFCQNLEYFNQNPEPTDGSLTEPLGQRLFKTRLELLSALDCRRASSEARETCGAYGALYSDELLREETAVMLQERVAGMSLDNFLVRPKRRWVERFAQMDAWKTLDDGSLRDLGEHVSGLPSTLPDEDEEAKRFDLLLLRLQLCVLNAEPGFARLSEKVREIAGALLEQTSIPAIAEHVLLIEAVAGEEWWRDVTVSMLEQARRKLRALIKLLEKRKGAVVYSNFEDELGDISEVVMPSMVNPASFERFREKARAFLRAHEDHLSLRKLRRNQPLTPTDLEALEQMLVESGGGAGDIHRAKEQAHGLGLFIRSLVGLDREAASEALSSFIGGRALSGNQLEFVNLVIQHLTEHGVMEARLLYESPFTDLTPAGPEGLFNTAQVDELFAALAKVKASAEAA
ncbi:DEAD/DEAH box helicase family protein [Pseudomonas sp. ZM24]|uniref:DEAD/DEAH box helicase family protein n=1 Tax=Pseudomonas triclosanedens TaxID=2961893 RepID=UPI0020C2B3D9|nr:DEAD/DEAH box helicase family protein [Pseudomonas triclosanedens]MCP8474475.1 DEAD/DEAH box helicase family protein [Pseudomonas triclosanedens]